VDLWRPERYPGALVFGDARLAPGSGTISKPIYPFGVEAVEALPHGLGVAAEFLGDPGVAQSLPAQGDDAGAQDPVPRSMTATGQLMDLALFIGILGQAGGE